MNVIRQGFGNVCCCRVVFAKIGSLVRYGFDCSYIQIYPPALVCTEIHNRKKVRKVIRRTPCHVCYVCMPAVGRKSFSLGRTSIEALLEKSAAKSCSNLYYVLMVILLISFAIFSYSVNRTKRKKKTPKKNKQNVELTKIPFTIKIRGKHESCLIPCSSVIRFRIFEMFHKYFAVWFHPFV